ncbi:MAG: FAD-binding oxidoreductase [Acidobacteriaceae bacterium]|nr:FAD-binding oxidoreductase [Acidobacteriaceae bacterium]
MPEPGSFEAFFFRSDASDGLPALIDALRALRLKDVLRSCIHIGNDYKVLGGLRQYPWADTGEQTPLSPAAMATFRKDLSFGYWNASGGLYGTRGQVSEAKRLLRNALASQAGNLRFLSPGTLQLAKRFARPFKVFTGWDIRRTIELVEPVFGLMRGVPTRHALASAYWRKRTPVPDDPDPDRDGCGLLWYAPVAPAIGSHVAKLASIATEVLLKFGFEPMISLTMVTPRTVSCVVSITYDREIAGKDEQAMACYDELVSRCNSEGYYPYRLGIQSMGRLTPRTSYTDLIRRLKKTFDPNGVLAPGRYDESEEFQAASDAQPQAAQYSGS